MPILHEAVPEAAWIARAEKQHFHFIAEPGSKGFTYIRFTFRKPLIAVFAMCGGVLLLACLNLASLLMARGAARERELATRLAMGATRVRLIQQLMMESLLIALMGTAIGLAVAPVVSESAGDDVDEWRRTGVRCIWIRRWTSGCLRLLRWLR